MNKIKLPNFLGVLLLVSLFSAPLYAQSGDRIGEALHDFSFVDPDGKPARLSDYRGEIVVVKLWATWCGACRAKWPEYQVLYDNLKTDENVRLVTLSVFENPAESQAWVDSQGYSVPLYKNLINDKGSVSVADGNEYFIKGTPMVFLLDKSGVIRKKSIGSASSISAKDIRTLL